jgi:hypothetical protein
MKYTVRVELHRATNDDYEQLHAAMKNVGFSRFITSSDNVKYHLPTAEYNYEGDASRDQVLEKAKRAASTTGLSYAVLVTESNGRTWHNLSKVS